MDGRIGPRVDGSLRHKAEHGFLARRKKPCEATEQAWFLARTGDGFDAARLVSGIGNFAVRGALPAWLVFPRRLGVFLRRFVAVGAWRCDVAAFAARTSASTTAATLARRVWIHGCWRIRRCAHFGTLRRRLSRRRFGRCSGLGVPSAIATVRLAAARVSSWRSARFLGRRAGG